MRTDADQLARAAIEATRRFCEAATLGWGRAGDGADAWCSTAATPVGNGVAAWRNDAAPDGVAELLAAVRDSGYPYCLQLREGAPAELTALAERWGLAPAEELPLMLRPAIAELAGGGELSGGSELSGGAEASVERAVAAGLKIEVLDVDDDTATEQFGRLLADGFEAPYEAFKLLAHPSILRARGLRSYVGRLDGEAVATGAGMVIGERVMIANIATLPDARRRGIGEAVTARAIADGHADGATEAFLFSSPHGYPVYERLGFHPVETWRIWMEPDAGEAAGTEAAAAEATGTGSINRSG